MPATQTYEELCAEAEAFRCAGRYEEASKRYRNALVLRPDSADGHYHLGLVCLFLGELEDAIDHLREASRFAPRHAASWINLGAVLNRIGRHPEAVEALRRGIQIDPALTEGYFNLGLAHRKLGQLELALQAYQECVRLKPRLADAQKNLADLYLELRRLPLAIDHYQKALKLRPHLDGARRRLRQAERIAALRRRARRQAGGVSPGSGEPRPGDAQAGSGLEVPPPPTERERAEALATLYSLAAKGEQLTEEWMQLIDEELSPAMKELNNSFIQPEGSRWHGVAAYRKFHEALERFESLQSSLHGNRARIQQQLWRLGEEKRSRLACRCLSCVLQSTSHMETPEVSPPCSQSKLVLQRSPDQAGHQR